MAINSNDDVDYPEDSFENMVKRARLKGYNFPYLRDASQQVARGYAATHIVGLTREDYSAFGAAEATDALEAIACALNLALGRRVDFALPVGWRDGTPTWSRWTAGRAEAFSPVPTWLDPMITSRQISETVGRVLNAWSNELKRETLYYASSYYLQALAQYAEAGTASAVFNTCIPRHTPSSGRSRSSAWRTSASSQPSRSSRAPPVRGSRSAP